MKHTPIVHRRVSAKDKKKGLLIWAFVLLCGFGLIHSQLNNLFASPVHAQDASVAFDDRLGELFPTSTVIYTNSVKTTRMKEPKTIKARVTYYSVKDSCHFPAKDGGCYSANYPHKIQRGDMACPKEYKFGTKVQYNGEIYICNDRTADWVQDKWEEPTFDIFVPTSKEVKPRVFTEVTIF